MKYLHVKMIHRLLSNTLNFDESIYFVVTTNQVNYISSSFVLCFAFQTINIYIFIAVAVNFVFAIKS